MGEKASARQSWLTEAGLPVSVSPGKSSAASGAPHGIHLRLRFPTGEEATRYNVIQKLSYLVLVLVLLPILVLAGLAMSPRLDAAWPELLTIFGGRQSARTIHFIAASTLVIFVIVHVIMVLISGVWNNMRSIITGRYWIETRAGTDA